MPVSPSDTAVPAPRRPGVASHLGGAAVTVEIVGSLDVLSAPGWTKVLIRAVQSVTSATDPAEPGHVVCDLGAVSLLAAAGVTALLEVDAYARSRGARFSVSAPPGPARRILELTGTRALF